MIDEPEKNDSSTAIPATEPAGVVGSCEIPKVVGDFDFLGSRLLLRPKEEWEASIVVGKLVRLALPKGGSVWARVKGFELKNLIPEGIPVAILIEWPTELGMTLPVGTEVYVDEGHLMKGDTNCFNEGRA